MRKLPTYIEDTFRRILSNDESLVVDPYRLPVGWNFERLLIEPEREMITIVSRHTQPTEDWIYCVYKVGYCSYNFVAPASLVEEVTGEAA